MQFYRSQVSVSIQFVELDDYKQFLKPSKSHLMVFPMRNVQGNGFQPLEMLDSLLSL